MVSDLSAVAATAAVELLDPDLVEKVAAVKVGRTAADRRP